MKGQSRSKIKQNGVQGEAWKGTCCALSGPIWAPKDKKYEKPKENHGLLKAPGGPKEAQKGPQKYLAGAGRCNQPLFWAILGSSWAVL